MRFSKGILALVLLGLGAGLQGAAAEDWGRFYHYPYSYFPYNYRKPFVSRDFDTSRFGYPMYPAYMAFPPYFRSDLYYPYHRHMKAGNNPKSRYQGNHFVMDVF